VVGDGVEGALRHGVDGKRRGESLHVQDVGGFWVLGAGAGKEEALGPSAGIGGPLEARGSEQLAIGLIGALGDCDAEPIGQLPGDLATDRDVPAADEERSDRGDCRVQSRLDAPLDAAQVGVSRRDILLAREQQRDIDRNAGEDRRLDGGKPFRGTGYLDEEVGLAGAPMEIARGRERFVGVMRQKRRDLERDPAVDPVGAGEDGPEQLRGPGQVRERQSEEQVLCRAGRGPAFGNVRVIGSGVLDRMIEDRGIRGEACDGELVDVALQGAVVQQLAGDVVEPQALTEIVEQLGRFHRLALSWMQGVTTPPAAAAPGRNRAGPRCARS
jgi:hypothetical protein